MKAWTVVRGLTPLVIALVLWQLVGDPNSPYFPPPSTWMSALDRMQTEGTLVPAVEETVVAVVIGVVASLAAGIALGIAVGLSPKLSAAISPTIDFVRSLPPPTLIPVVTLLVGVNTRSVVSVAVAAALWPVALNTIRAVRSVPHVTLEASRSLRLGRLRTLRSVILPAALPGILTGVRNAVPLAVVVVVLTEMLTFVGGLGALVMKAQRSFVTADVFGLLIVIGLIGLAFTAVVDLAERRILRSRPH